MIIRVKAMLFITVFIIANVLISVKRFYLVVINKAKEGGE